jgi:hypothetical protein
MTWWESMTKLLEGATQMVLLHGNVLDGVLQEDGVVKPTESVIAEWVIAKSERLVKLDPGFLFWDQAAGYVQPVLSLSAHVHGWCAKCAEGKEKVTILVTQGEYLLGMTKEGTALALALCGAVRAFPEVRVIILAEDIGMVHPALRRASRAVEIPLADAKLVAEALRVWVGRPGYEGLVNLVPGAEERLSGVPLLALSNFLKQESALGRQIVERDYERVKQKLVEDGSAQLLEFIEPTRTLDDLVGGPSLDILRAHLKRDIEIWKSGSKRAVPKGYLFVGPVGTGKSFIVEAMGGSAGVPVIRIGQFRDPQPGKSEANLAKIFRMLAGIPRAYVFIDEADQAMGSRQSGVADGGMSGRIYAMFAEEMAAERNRGRIIWVLATSQPHKLEPDLKRPGRMDLKVPLLPCESPKATMALLQALGRPLGLDFTAKERPVSVSLGAESMAETPEERLDKELWASIPLWVTPGAAVVIVNAVYAKKQEGRGLSDRALLKEVFDTYQPPIPVEVMEEQSRLAVQEASNLDLVPEELRYLAKVRKPYAEL